MNPSSFLRPSPSALALGLGLLAAGSLPAASFTAGNLVVYTIDRGSGSLNTAATPVVLQEFSPNTTTPLAPVQSIPLVTTGTNAFTASGTAASDGGILLSGDGTFLSFAGYNVNSGTAAVTGTIPRLFAIAALDGTVSYSAPFPISATNVRGAASASIAAGFYVYSSDGFGYAPTLTAPLYCTTGQVTVRGATIFAGQLYGSTGSSTYNNGVNSIDGGLPTEPAYYRALPGFASTTNDSPNALRFLSLGRTGRPDTLWLALGRTGGGIQRYNFDGTTWTLAYTLNPATAVGFYGLVVRVDPQDSTKVRIYATTQPGTTNGGANQLVTFTDSATAGNVTSPGPVTLSVLATAGGPQMFRGVDFAPMAAAPAGTLQVTTYAPNAQGALLVARGEAGRAYMVQSSTDLTSPWQNASPVLYADQFGQIEYQDVSAPAVQRFYRFVTVP